MEKQETVEPPIEMIKSKEYFETIFVISLLSEIVEIIYL